MLLSEQFPVFRLVTLLARQLSSPIATRVKEYARQHPRLAGWLCAKAGRALRSAELRCKLWALRLPAPTRPLSLPEREAIDAGADIIGEITIFAIGSAIIIFEVNRQAMIQEAKVLDEQSRWLAVLLSLEELHRELQLQQADIDRLRGLLRDAAA